MADTWSYAAGVWTLAMDGSGSGQVSRSVTITGLTPDTLYTFYSTVNADSVAVGAFIEVDGGDRTTIEETGSALQFVRGTTDGSGNITLRRGVAEAGDAPGTFFFEDDLDSYATTADYVTGGWTLVTTGGGSLAVENDPALTDGQTNVLKASVATSGTAYITRTFSCTPGTHFNLKGWSRNDIDRGFDTSTRIDFSPGPTSSNNHDEWAQEDIETTQAGSSFAIKIGRMGGFFGIGGTYFGLFSRITLDDGTGGGTSDVTWTDWDYCEGTGVGDGGTGLGGDPDTPGEEPIPGEPPGGYPAPPVGGSRPFGIHDIPAGGFSFWNSTVKQVLSSNIVNVLNDAGTGGCKLMLSFGGINQWLDAAGKFSFTRWQAVIDACYDNTAIRARINTGITDGEFWCHRLLDEPNRADRYGGEVPVATVERMAQYSKELFPTLRTLVRLAPNSRYLRAVDRHLVGVDALWAEYLLPRGDIYNYQTENIALCEEWGHQLIFGLHYGAFNTSSMTEPWRPISPSELRHYGGILASTTSDALIGMSGWRYTTAMYNQPGFLDALKYVRDLFASHDP